MSKLFAKTISRWQNLPLAGRADGVQTIVFSWSRCFEFFFLNLDKYDLVHNVEIVFGHCKQLTAYEN